MRILMNVLAVFLILVGALMLFKSSLLFDWINAQKGNQSFYILATVGRAAFGLLLLAAAKYSRFPGIFKFLGCLTLIIAVCFIFIGHEQFTHFIDTILRELKPYAFVSGLISIALGGFFIYAFLTNEELTK